MNKRILGIILMVFGIALVIFSISKANATFSDWSACTLSGPQCGTDNGTQHKTIYADAIVSCPFNYHYQNNGNWNERCHKNNGASRYLPEHTSPTGVTCPEGYTKSGNNEDTVCSKTVYQSCHTGQNDYTACEPTPSPTIVDCDENCITPSPTATPEATPTPVDNGPHDGSSPTPEGNVSTTTPPGAPSCTIDFDKPILQGFNADGNGSVTFSWWPVGGIDKYSIIYGYEPDNLIFGENDIPATSTSIQLNGLTPGNNVWAKVYAWKGGCAEISNELDPIVK